MNDCFGAVMVIIWVFWCCEVVGLSCCELLRSYCIASPTVCERLRGRGEGEAACCEIQKKNDKTRTGEGVKEKKRMEMPQGED